MRELQRRLVAATRVLNLHRPRRRPDVVIVASPRSGSTWLFEIVLAADRFLAINEPLDLRRANVRRHLPGLTWERLYEPAEIATVIGYLRRVSDGRLAALKPDLSNPYHRFRTHRTAFKILHGLEGHVRELAAALPAQVIVLLRHPCAVAVSREHLPRLAAFATPTCLERCDPAQRALTAETIATGDFLQQAVLHWCFETKRVVDEFADDWLMVFYEKLVSEPRTQIDRIAAFLNVPAAVRTRMGTRVNVASQSSRKSDAETRRMLAYSDDRTRALLSKWRRLVAADDLRRVDEIVRVFGLERFYDTAHDVPLGTELGIR